MSRDNVLDAVNRNLSSLSFASVSEAVDRAEEKRQKELRREKARKRKKKAEPQPRPAVNTDTQLELF